MDWVVNEIDLLFLILQNVKGQTTSAVKITKGFANAIKVKLLFGKRITTVLRQLSG